MNNLVSENMNDGNDLFDSPEADPFSTDEKMEEEDFFGKADNDEIFN